MYQFLNIAYLFTFHPSNLACTMYTCLQSSRIFPPLISITFILVSKYIWTCHYIFKQVNLLLIMKPKADNVYYEEVFSRKLTYVCVKKHIHSIVHIMFFSQFSAAKGSFRYILPIPYVDFDIEEYVCHNIFQTNFLYFLSFGHNMSLLKDQNLALKYLLCGKAFLRKLGSECINIIYLRLRQVSKYSVVYLLRYKQENAIL